MVKRGPRAGTAITWMGMKMTYTDIPMSAVGPRMKKAYTAQAATTMGMVAGKGPNKAASNKEELSFDSMLST